MAAEGERIGHVSCVEGGAEVRHRAVSWMMEGHSAEGGGDKHCPLTLQHGRTRRQPHFINEKS